MIKTSSQEKIWLRILLGIVFGFLGVILFFQSVYAQGTPPTDDEVNQVAKEMYCPVCENIPLDVCPTQACAQWRDLIREKLAAGWSEGQIKDYFVLQYGDRVLATPPARGLNWLVYLLPPLILVGGGVIVFNVLRTMKKRSAVSTALVEEVGQALDDSYVSRLEEELKKREEES